MKRRAPLHAYPTINLPTTALQTALWVLDKMRLATQKVRLNSSTEGAALLGTLPFVRLVYSLPAFLASVSLSGMNLSVVKAASGKSKNGLKSNHVGKTDAWLLLCSSTFLSLVRNREGTRNGMTPMFLKKRTLWFQLFLVFSFSGEPNAWVDSISPSLSHRQSLAARSSWLPATSTCRTWSSSTPRCRRWCATTSRPRACVSPAAPWPWFHGCWETFGCG